MDLPSQKTLLGDAERFERAARTGCPDRGTHPRAGVAGAARARLADQYADARVVSCVGGMDPRAEQRQLAAGAHIVVGTPGPSLRPSARAVASTSRQLKAVVLDEADEMLDLGFREDMEYLAREIAALRIALGEVATRDYLRSELTRLAEELDESAHRRAKLARKEHQKELRRAARQDDEVAFDELEEQDLGRLDRPLDPDAQEELEPVRPRQTRSSRASRGQARDV